MTAALAVARNADTWTVGAPRLLAGLDTYVALDRDTHLAVHGPLPATDLDRLLGLLDAVNLAGRGGGAFPFAAKLRGLRGLRPTIVVNGSESEPASHKDRTLLRRTPHLVLDGAIAVATALRARRVTVAVHDPAAARAVQAALAQRTDARRVRVETVVGGFVAGEARALARALSGGPALPPGRHQHLNEQGILVANVETFAQTAVLLRMGPHRFAQTGTRAEPGTTLLTVGGAVDRPGVVEIPLGTPLGIVLDAAGAVDPQAVVVGGYHGTWLTPRPDVLLSRAGLADAGAALAAGVLYVVDGHTCALGELARVAAWLADESAKQCGPCRFGLPALAADVAALCHGDPTAARRAHHHGQVVIGRGACKHPDGAARFVRTGLEVLRAEVDAHLDGRCGRPVMARLPIGGPR